MKTHSMSCGFHTGKRLLFVLLRPRRLGVVNPLKAGLNKAAAPSLYESRKLSHYYKSSYNVALSRNLTNIMSSLDLQTAGKVGLRNTLVPILKKKNPSEAVNHYSWLQCALQNVFLFAWSMAQWNEMFYGLRCPAPLPLLGIVCYCSSPLTVFPPTQALTQNTHKTPKNNNRLIKAMLLNSYNTGTHSNMHFSAQGVSLVKGHDSPSHHKGSGSSLSLTPPHAPQAGWIWWTLMVGTVIKIVD